VNGRPSGERRPEQPAPDAGVLQEPGASARIGLLAPPSNVVMEVDFYRSLPADITVHTSHIYRSNRTVSRASATETADNAVQTAMTLAQVRPDVVLYGHAASSYAGGAEGDRRIAEGIHEALGRPVLTTAGAAVRCLRSVRAARIGFLAPYPEAIAKSGADFLAAAGFEICALNGMGIDQVADLREVPLRTTYELAMKTAAESNPDTLYICGTGIRTRELVGPLERALGKPVVTANMAALWASLDAIGRGDRFAFGESRLLEWQRLRAT